MRGESLKICERYSRYLSGLLTRRQSIPRLIEMHLKAIIQKVA